MPPGVSVNDGSGSESITEPEEASFCLDVATIYLQLMFVMRRLFLERFTKQLIIGRTARRTLL